MSFQDKGFWMSKGGGNMNEGETVFDDSTRIENKRAHHWFSDDSETELFSNKRQAVQPSVNKPSSGVSLTNSLPWENTSGYQSVPNLFIDRLFGPESTTPSTLPETNVSQVVTETDNTTNEGINEHFETESSVGLSMSYTVEDPECVSYGGIRKVKINQVKDSETENEPTYVSMGQIYSKEDENNTLLIHNPYKEDPNMGPTGPIFTKSNDNTISFGAYQDDVNALAKPVNSYNNMLYNNQSSIQTSEQLVKHKSDGSNLATKSKNDSVSKNKTESKPVRKEAPNSFPSNVRSLMATGILDGVPVRYIAINREELRGIIKGSGYLCGCQSCNYTKALNAYEFERHADYKTKHPNNHIYFENGKTIYQIVQELRNTPGSQLFDAIQTVTGSPINQKAFRIWKESFQAATRELQRIYGKGELNL